MFYIKNGGFIMYIILFFSILGLYAILERFFYFIIYERNNFSSLSKEFKNFLEEKKLKESIIYLNKNKSSTSKILKNILIFAYKENNEDIATLENKAKELIFLQEKKLDRNIWILSLVSNTTPLLGLLGTVTGMIKSFDAISKFGTGDPSILAKGISEALYTTAGGLIVAIPCMIFYNYFTKKIDNIFIDIEKTTTELLNYFRRLDQYEN